MDAVVSMAMESEAIGNFNAELIAQAALMQARVEFLEKENRALSSKLEESRQNESYYKECMAKLRQELFGKKSERRVIPEDTRMELLPGFSDELRPVVPAVPEKETIPSYERNKPSPERGATRLARSSRFPATLRRQVTVLEPEDKMCSCCDTEMTHVIRTEVTEKLCCSRDPFYVQEYHRPVYGCRACEEVASKAELPEVFERTAVDQSVVSYLLVNKFRHSMPLYRQGQMFRDISIEFSNDALIDWSLKGLDLLFPVYLELVRFAKSSGYLVADDTRLRAAVGVVTNKQPTYRQGAMWGLYAIEHDVVAYVFTAARTHAACREVLRGFEGYLIVDGYDGFEPIAKSEAVTLVNCNNHARRGFVRAENYDRKRSQEALLFYQELYRVEEEARGLSPDERRKLRQEKAVPIFERFRKWLEMVNTAAPPKSSLGKACAYVLRRWTSLTVYLDDGMVPIDTMAVERAFRVIAVGRKNFLHAASELGAHGAAVGYSLVNTCLAQGIDPFIYICDVLERVQSCSQHEVESLLPHRWKGRYLEEATARFGGFPGSDGTKRAQKIESDNESGAAA